MPHTATGPMPRLSNTGPIPRVSNTGPIPRVYNTGPMPRLSSTGPIPRVSNTGPIPRVDTGPIPRVSNTGPIPRVDTGPIPRINNTGPQRISPPGSAPGDVPGYEFETRRLRRAGRGQQQGLRDGQRQGRPAPPRGTSHGIDPSEPRRFRYTPTVSSGPAQDWPEDRPGFEFDGPFPAAHRRPRPARPAPPRRPPSGPRPRRDRPASGPAREKPQAAQGGNEWTRLLRSFLPQPERRNLAKEFKANLSFRGWALRVGVPILTMIAVGIAVVVIVGAHSTTNSPAPGATALGFPPATLAGRDFTASPSTRGLTQQLGRVAADGSAVVAVGGQSGGRIARAQFFFSHNGGTSWSLATESVAGGGPPPPGHAATLVAGGGGNWVALGPDAIWVSGSGEAWTLVSTTGLPARSPCCTGRATGSSRSAPTTCSCRRTA